MFTTECPVKIGSNRYKVQGQNLKVFAVVLEYLLSRNQAKCKSALLLKSKQRFQQGGKNIPAGPFSF